MSFPWRFAFARVCVVLGGGRGPILFCVGDLLFGGRMFCLFCGAFGFFVSRAYEAFWRGLLWVLGHSGHFHFWTHVQISKTKK